MTPTLAGRYYHPAENTAAIATLLMVADTLRAFPFFVAPKTTFDELKVRVSTPLAATNFRIGIYQNLNGYPGAKIVETGLLDGNTGAVQTVAVTPFTLNGLYWLVVNANGATTLRAVPIVAIPNVLGVDPVLGANSQITMLDLASTFDVLPTPFPAGASTGSSTLAPLLAMRASVINP
jgi:hypothetical protein